MSLGLRLAQKRNEANLSQQELAEKIGVSPTMISLYESNSRKPSYQKLEDISFYLNTTVNFLMRGELDIGNDPINQKINMALKYLDRKQRQNIWEYICRITGVGSFDFELPSCFSPEECAQGLIRKLKQDMSIDPYNIAKILDIEILGLENESEYEGILLKSLPKPTILIDKTSRNEVGRRFTIAMFIGNLVMPWHLRNSFTRLRGQKSVEVNDPLDIESREFATALLMPKQSITKDRKKFERLPKYADFENLAKEYKVSITTYIKRFISVNEVSNMAFLRCKDGEILEENQKGLEFKVKKVVDPNTFAGRLMLNLPEEPTTISGYVDAKLWFSNPMGYQKIFEESFIDPKFKVAMTLLKIE